MKKTLLALSGILLSGSVVLLPFEGLSMDGRIALGILTGAIVWWVTQVLPDFVTAMIMSVLFIQLAHIPTSVAFSAFSGSAWWIVTAAFGLGLGVSKCGLLKRVSRQCIRLFPATFSGQTAGLLTVGFLTAPFIPSMSAKAAILAPLSLEISDSMGFTRKDRPSSGLFLATLVGLRNPGPLFISASVIGYALVGQYPEETVRAFPMGQWFFAALVWFLTVTVLCQLALYLLYRPKQAPQAAEQTAYQADDLGPITPAEVKMAVISGGTMLLWATESLHAIPAHLVAIVALCLTLALNIIDPKTLCRELNWGSILFIGIALSIGTVFSHLEINDWLIQVLAPLLRSFSAHRWSFLLCVACITILTRFLIVSEVSYVNIMMVVLVPLSIAIGLQPWVTGFTVYTVISPWFFLYQNPVYMAAYYAGGEAMIEQKEAARFCFYYLVICLIGLGISLPFWTYMGILNL